MINPSLTVSERLLVSGIVFELNARPHLSNDALAAIGQDDNIEEARKQLMTRIKLEHPTLVVHTLNLEASRLIHDDASTSDDFLNTAVINKDQISRYWRSTCRCTY